MATVATVTPGSNLGTALQELLVCGEIVPGSEPSYQICKTIFLFHPLGQKMTEGPVKVSQSIPRKITVTDSPEDDVVREFNEQWRRDGVDITVRNVATQARVYGISSLSLLEKDRDPSDPLDMARLSDAVISYNVLDPLNTAGSLVLNQDPNAMDFQKHQDIRVAGVTYHRSRTVTLMNEQPIYISYTSSAFGFVGRSVFQRALFPLKSFVQTMQADDMVARKVGLLVAMMKQAGSIVDAVMQFAAAFKRTVLKIGATDNVLSVGHEDKIESLNLTNLEAPLQVARKDILENIAAADDMPAVMLNSETFAQGFADGTEDAKRVAQYCGNMRAWMQPVYTFMDDVTQRRAWTPKFYETIQRKYPDMYGKMPYEEAFYRWKNSFTAEWPSLLQEPESEMVRVAETKFKSAVAVFQVIIPELDPENKKRSVMWLADIVNSARELFPSPLDLDQQALEDYTPPEGQELQEPPPAQPFSARDSDDGDVIPMRRRMLRLEGALKQLTSARR